MDAVTLLKLQIAEAQHEFNGALVDVTQEMAAWQPPGTANSIAALLLHVAIGTDRSIHSRGQGKPMLLDEWAPRLGIAPDFRLTPETAKALRMDFKQLREYWRAVDSASNAFLATLTDPKQLDREVEWFRGKMTLGGLLGHMLINHLSEHTGEVAALKGIQGAKGYATT